MANHKDIRSECEVQPSQFHTVLNANWLGVQYCQCLLCSWVGISVNWAIQAGWVTFPMALRVADIALVRSTPREESSQTNVILKYKLLASIFNAVCSVIQQS